MTSKIFLMGALVLGLSACMQSGGGVTDAPEPGTAETTGDAISEPTDGLENEIETE